MFSGLERLVRVTVCVGVLERENVCLFIRSFRVERWLLCFVCCVAETPVPVSYRIEGAVVVSHCSAQDNRKWPFLVGCQRGIGVVAMVTGTSRGRCDDW